MDPASFGHSQAGPRLTWHPVTTALNKQGAIDGPQCVEPLRPASRSVLSLFSRKTEAATRGEPLRERAGGGRDGGGHEVKGEREGEAGRHEVKREREGGAGGHGDTLQAPSRSFDPRQVGGDAIGAAESDEHDVNLAVPSTSGRESLKRTRVPGGELRCVATASCTTLHKLNELVVSRCVAVRRDVTRSWFVTSRAVDGAALGRDSDFGKSGGGSGGHVPKVTDLPDPSTRFGNSPVCANLLAECHGRGSGDDDDVVVVAGRAPKRVGEIKAVGREQASERQEEGEEGKGPRTGRGSGAGGVSPVKKGGKPIGQQSLKNFFQLKK